MKQILHLLCSMALLASLTGCVSAYPDPRTRKVAQEREDLLLVKEDIRRLQGQVEGVQMETENIRGDINRSMNSGNQATQHDISSLRSRISEIENRISSLEASRERDKQEIINTLSANMTKALSSQAPRSSAPRASKPRKPKSDYVLEHPVESGQTLSEIARVYGTSVQVIMDENDLKNANSIRVGQILYIPE